MNLNQLKARQDDLQHINIITNEGDIYLVEAAFADHTELLVNDNGSPRTYAGVYHVKESLESHRIPAYKLVFDSPYEEI